MSDPPILGPRAPSEEPLGPEVSAAWPFTTAGNRPQRNCSVAALRSLTFTRGPNHPKPAVAEDELLVVIDEVVVEDGAGGLANEEAEEVTAGGLPTVVVGGAVVVVVVRVVLG